mmetsp:Transcript_35170/g.68944  ORF Transcript_35170/g.68944 Transcript_35170/m.68944 type:complete len:210 (+) Transcript_35170:2359-2988(+)
MLVWVILIASVTDCSVGSISVFRSRLVPTWTSCWFFRRSCRMVGTFVHVPTPSGNRALLPTPLRMTLKRVDLPDDCGPTTATLGGWMVKPLELSSSAMLVILRRASNSIVLRTRPICFELCTTCAGAPPAAGLRVGIKVPTLLLLYLGTPTSLVLTLINPPMRGRPLVPLRISGFSTTSYSSSLPLSDMSSSLMATCPIWAAPPPKDVS